MTNYKYHKIFGLFSFEVIYQKPHCCLFNLSSMNSYSSPCWLEGSLELMLEFSLLLGEPHRDCCFWCWQSEPRAGRLCTTRKGKVKGLIAGWPIVGHNSANLWTVQNWTKPNPIQSIFAPNNSLSLFCHLPECTILHVWMWIGRLRWENVYVRNHFSTGKNSARQEMRMQIEERSPGVGSLVELRLRPAAPSTSLQPTLSVMSLDDVTYIVSTSRYDIKDRDENLCWSHWANLTALGWLGLATKANTGSPFTTKNCFRTPRSCIVALLQFIEHILLIETFVMKTCFTTNLDPSGQETLRWWKYEHFKLRFQ